jgi:hypothetical protein
MANDMPNPVKPALDTAKKAATAGKIKSIKIKMKFKDKGGK